MLLKRAHIEVGLVTAFDEALELHSSELNIIVIHMIRIEKLLIANEASGEMVYLTSLLCTCICYFRFDPEANCLLHSSQL